jgi:hypothetical protein
MCLPGFSGWRGAKPSKAREQPPWHEQRQEEPPGGAPKPQRFGRSHQEHAKLIGRLPVSGQSRILKDQRIDAKTATTSQEFSVELYSVGASTPELRNCLMGFSNTCYSGNAPFGSTEMDPTNNEARFRVYLQVVELYADRCGKAHPNSPTWGRRPPERIRYEITRDGVLLVRWLSAFAERRDARRSCWEF